MGKRRNKYKNKPKSINMITMATLNNPHSTNVHQTIKHNVRNATASKTIDLKYTNVEYYEDGIKFIKENGDITYYLY